MSQFNFHRHNNSVISYETNKGTIMSILNITRLIMTLLTSNSFCMFSFLFFSSIVTYFKDTKQDFQFLLKQPKKVECELRENCGWMDWRVNSSARISVQLCSVSKQSRVSSMDHDGSIKTDPLSDEAEMEMTWHECCKSVVMQL